MRENSKYHIALGTNLGDRDKNLEFALQEINLFAKIIKKSSIHETRPYGYVNQEDFLNQVIEIETSFAPMELIIQLHEIEHKMGRVRYIENGPRVIDLDILLNEDHITDTDELKIPHKDMHKRRFVLKPLAEIAPDIVHPILNKSIKTLLEEAK